MDMMVESGAAVAVGLSRMLTPWSMGIVRKKRMKKWTLTEVEDGEYESSEEASSSDGDEDETDLRCGKLKNEDEDEDIF